MLFAFVLMNFFIEIWWMKSSIIPIGIHYIPIGTETLGTFGPEAIKFLEGHKLGLINREKRSKSFLFQSIGISIQKGNAACILGTKEIHGKLEELPYL